MVRTRTSVNIASNAWFPSFRNATHCCAIPALADLRRISKNTRRELLCSRRVCWTENACDAVRYVTYWWKRRVTPLKNDSRRLSAETCRRWRHRREERVDGTERRLVSVERSTSAIRQHVAWVAPLSPRLLIGPEFAGVVNAVEARPCRGLARASLASNTICNIDGRLVSQRVKRHCEVAGTKSYDDVGTVYLLPRTHEITPWRYLPQTLPREKIWKLALARTPDPNRLTRRVCFENWH